MQGIYFFLLVCFFLSLDNIIKRELLASKIVSRLFNLQYNIVLIIIPAMVIYVRKLPIEWYIYLYKVWTLLTEYFSFKKTHDYTFKCCRKKRDLIGITIPQNIFAGRMRIHADCDLAAWPWWKFLKPLSFISLLVEWEQVSQMWRFNDLGSPSSSDTGFRLLSACQLLHL